MPTIASSNVPTPKSWDEFEDITLAAAKLRWNSSDFYRNGRPGQKQDGVDIWGHDDDNRQLGVQCKNTVNGISLATVEAEIANAQAFEPKLDRLYVATTAKRDAVLQKKVREISEQRAKAGVFKVDLLFWDDISQDLAKDDDVFFRHYPQFRQGTDPVRDHDKKLFDELIALLSSDGVIGFIDRFNMAGWLFQDSELDPLSEFHARWSAPERQFITPELEAARKALWSKARDYLRVIAIETFPANTPGWRSVPEEWEDEQPERFRRVVKELHTLAGEIVQLHAELVRVGQERLIRSRE
ncbi:hypothetical protein ABIG06_007337 [Bradyrhizobium sp. USDA 326]|uniref:hypothetical protein n=1 Tax=unclassified Bradyrhizobium TaxID=2631580 RepID=UPI003512C0D1